MNFKSIIDISAFIWDEDDYNENKYQYYDLVKFKISLLDILQENNILFLMRPEFQEMMWSKFPYNNHPLSTRDLEGRILRFLSQAKFQNFSNDILDGLTSCPEQIKSFYELDLISEVKVLLSKMHINNSNEDFVFFTFDILFDGIDNLKTIKPDVNDAEHQTVIVDKIDLDVFLKTKRLSFDHNIKHNKANDKNREAWENSDDGNRKKFVSQLSCFDGMTNEIPQKILDERYPVEINGSYIGFDYENSEYVIFKCHFKNLYHGYDEYDKTNVMKIPKKVRNFFEKNERI